LKGYTDPVQDGVYTEGWTAGCNRGRRSDMEGDGMEWNEYNEEQSLTTSSPSDTSRH
jgi:hypothetical protein